MRINTITLSGNLTADPNLKFYADGKPITKFAIAHNKRYMKKGDWKTDTSFFNITIFRDVSQELKKGDMVVVVGEINVTNSDSGTWVEITANSAIKCERKSKNNQSDHCPDSPDTSEYSSDDKVPF